MRLPFRRRDGQDETPDDHRFILVSRALAKTVTFRLFATIADFTVTFLVVGDAATAAGLVALGFVIGPFVYYGHEKAWKILAARGAARLVMPVFGAAPSRRVDRACQRMVCSEDPP